MDEPSGLGASRIHTNILYSHDDENDDAEVYAIDATNGRVLATFPIRGAANIDWEDLAVGPCGRNDNRSCIYVHDDGSGIDVNADAHPVIYKVVEPNLIWDQELPIESKLYYTWSEKSSNTLMVDPHGDLYIIASNYHDSAKMAKLPNSAWGNSSQHPVEIHSDYYFGVVSQKQGPDGADISPDGKEIIIINDGILYYYKKYVGSYLETLSGPGQKIITRLVGFSPDMAVCWSANGFRGFGPVGYIGNTYQYRTHMDEPSGLGASRIHTNILYAHDDENDDAEVYAIDATNGRVLATFPVIGATNLDWEDLAVGPCGRNDHRSCIYIHDDGNDSDVNAHGDPVIYKIVEPAVIRNQNLPIESKLYYTWSGGSSNTLMVDPHSDIYVIASNYHHRVKMAKLPSSAWGNSPHSPAKLHANYYFGVVPQRPGPDGADISPNGKEIIIINDGILYYYTTDDGDYLHTLSSSGQKLVTQLAGYGTDMAVSWSADGQSVYILDEKTDELFKLDKI